MSVARLASAGWYGYPPAYEGLVQCGPLLREVEPKDPLEARLVWREVQLLAPSGIGRVSTGATRHKNRLGPHHRMTFHRAGPNDDYQFRHCAFEEIGTLQYLLETNSKRRPFHRDVFAEGRPKDRQLVTGRVLRQQTQRIRPITAVDRARLIEDVKARGEAPQAFAWAADFAAERGAYDGDTWVSPPGRTRGLDEQWTSQVQRLPSASAPGETARRREAEILGAGLLPRRFGTSKRASRLS